MYLPLGFALAIIWNWCHVRQCVTEFYNPGENWK